MMTSRTIFVEGNSESDLLAFDTLPSAYISRGAMPAHMGRQSHNRAQSQPMLQPKNRRTRPF